MIFLHLCKECSHPQGGHVHDPKRLMQAMRGFNPCVCCDREPAPEFDPEPVARETYLPGGVVEDHVYEPGSTRNAGTAHREHLCGCDECRVLFGAFAEVPF